MTMNKSCRIFIAFGLIVGSFLSLSCSKDKSVEALVASDIPEVIDHYTFDDIATHKDVKYADWLGLNIFNKATDDGQSRPVVFFVHGGAWNSGYKEHWDTPQIAYFAKMGFMSVSIDHILSPNPCDTLDDRRNIHPRHISSVAHAFNWVYNNISRYGGDSTRIYVLGHSSGAHLALLLSTNERFLASKGRSLSDIRATYCSDGGPYLGPIELMSPVSPDPTLRLLHTIWVNAMGNDRNRWEDAIPMQHITPGKQIPPILLIHTDPVYRVTANRQIEAKLIEHAYTVERYQVNGIDHSEMTPFVGTSRDQWRIGYKIVTFFRYYQ